MTHSLRRLNAQEQLIRELSWARDPSHFGWVPLPWLMVDWSMWKKTHSFVTSKILTVLLILSFDRWYQAWMVSKFITRTKCIYTKVTETKYCLLGRDGIFWSFLRRSSVTFCASFPNDPTSHSVKMLQSSFGSLENVFHVQYT